MAEDMKCPYEELCKKQYPGSDMDDFRTSCDCVNCAMCDRYWVFYDQRYLEKLNRIQMK